MTNNSSANLGCVDGGTIRVAGETLFDAADPATQAWWDVVKPLMQPLPDRKEGEFWSDMEEIYHLD